LKIGARPSLDELDFKPVDRKKLAQYMEKYPDTVRTVLMRSLAFEQFAV